jgi:drug/metabolite transporter (DMT)-like permease
MERSGHLAMLGFAALVAGSFALGSRAAPLIDPLALTAARFWLAAALLVPLALRTASRGAARPTLARGGAPGRWAILGSLYAIYFVLMFEGLKTAPPVGAAAVFTLTPLMAAGFGWLLLRQRLSRRAALALGIGAGGALWVVFRGDIGALLALTPGRGEAIYLVGCIAHALYTPLFRLWARGEGLARAALWTSLAGAVLLTTLGAPAILATDWRALPGIVWLTLGYTAAFATVASMLLLQFASLRLPAARVMAYTWLVPAFVLVWEAALGGPLPGAPVWPGLALTGVALALLLRPDQASGASGPAGRSAASGDSSRAR